MTSEMFLELRIRNGQLASHKYKDLYQEAEETDLSHSGRGDWTRTSDLLLPKQAL